MVETLDDYYANGTLRRIDEYIDITSSQIDAALPYQQVTFEYQGRGTKLAALYEQAENVGWGTETFEIDNEILGNPYKISVGFEHMQFERLPGTDVQTGYFIDDNNEPYIGMPLIFYRELITSGLRLLVSYLAATTPSPILRLLYSYELGKHFRRYKRKGIALLPRDERVHAYGHV
jgi:hypothetical protein